MSARDWKLSMGVELVSKSSVHPFASCASTARVGSPATALRRFRQWLGVASRAIRRKIARRSLAAA